MRRIAPILICLAVSAACTWCGLAVFRAATRPAIAGTTPSSVARAVTAPPAAERVEFATEPPLDAAAEPPPADFDAAVDRLVALGVAMVEALERHDTPSVLESNATAERLLVAITNGFPAAGELALDRRTRLEPAASSAPDRIRGHVLERVLADALERRQALAERGPDRSRLDELVTAMLACLPQCEALAVALGDLLVDHPYLGPAHEVAVLELAEAATGEPFLVGVAAALLRTLWRNLEATGARTSDQLAGLALVFLDDGSATRRLAAMRQLVRDARYRDLVVHEIVRSRDVGLATQIGETAAVELEPSDALEVLGVLQRIDGASLLGAFVALGTRDPGLLMDGYERILADGIRPALRAELVTGASAGGSGIGLEAARTAYGNDPDPEVRMRALFALAAQPDRAAAEAALMGAIDDPRGATDPEWIAGVAMALENLALGGALDELERVGERLARHPSLDEPGRRAVRALLAEHLPSGGR